jgi:hypothetical protein
MDFCRRPWANRGFESRRPDQVFVLACSVGISPGGGYVRPGEKLKLDP